MLRCFEIYEEGRQNNPKCIQVPVRLGVENYITAESERKNWENIVFLFPRGKVDFIEDFQF